MTDNTPTDINRAAIEAAQIAEFAALTLEHRRLQDGLQNPHVRDYLSLWSDEGKRLGFTRDQIIGAAVVHMDVDAFRDSILPPELCDELINHFEGRALAAVAEDSAEDLCPCGAFEVDGHVLHSARCALGDNVGSVTIFRLRKPRR